MFDLLKENIKQFLAQKSSQNILIVRHGLIEANLKDILVGRSNDPLAPQGIEQIKYLQSQIGDIEWSKFDQIYSSPLERCIQTAKLLLPPKQFESISLDSRLKELDFGNDEGKSVPSLSQSEFDRIITWEYSAQNGESWKNVEQRYAQFFKSLPKQGNFLAFSHGGAMGAILVWGPLQNKKQQVLNNGSLLAAQLGLNGVEKVLWEFNFPIEALNFK